MKIPAVPLIAVLMTLAAPVMAQQSWQRVAPSGFEFEQVSLRTKPQNDASGNPAVQVSAVFRITNTSSETLEGVRWVWPWGIGFHLYATEKDQIFERRWDEKMGEFVFYGQDAWFDGEPGVSLTPVGMDGLMSMADTNLSATSDAENYAWLGVDMGAVPAADYPAVSVDANANVPYYDLGTIAPKQSVDFTYGAFLEYPNDPVPSQVGFYGLAELVQQVPESSALVMALGGLLLAGRRRR